MNPWGSVTQVADPFWCLWPVVGVPINGHVDVIANGIDQFFREVAKQSGAAREQSDPTRDSERNIDIGDRSPAYAGTVERQGLAENRWVCSPNCFEQRQVRSEHIVLAGETEQYRGARVSVLMHGVTEPGDE